MDLFSLLADQTFWTALTALGTVAALGYLAQQNISLKKSLSFDTQWRKKDKAAELALFYSREIVPRISYCMSIFARSGASEKLGTINTSKINRFTAAELDQICSHGKTLRTEVNKAIRETDSRVFETQRDQLPAQFKKTTDLRQSESNRHKFLLNEFTEISAGLLNDLEYFSMCINCGIADGDVIYQSLHQTFFDTVQIFYFQIASVNVSSKDKYYTHIISLYQKWHERYEEQEKLETNLENEICNGYSPIN